MIFNLLHAIKKSIYGLFLIIVLIAAPLIFLLTTTPGLALSFNIARIFLPGKIKVGQLHGRLMDHFTIDSLDYRLKDATFSARDLSVFWTLRPLLHGELRINQINVNQFTLDKTQIAIHGTIREPAVDLSSQLRLAHLDKPIDLSGRLYNANRGNLRFQLKNAHYQLDNIPRIPVRHGEINAVMNPELLRIQGKVVIDDQKTLQINLKLPGFSLDKSITHPQAIQGGVNLNIHSLDFLDGVADGIEKIKGMVKARLDIKGTLQAPALTSTLELSQGKMTIPRLGLDLNPVQLKVQSTKKQWQATGSLGSQGKTLTINGQGEFLPLLKGVINLQGQDFTLINNKDYKVNISPEIQLGFSPDTLTLTGKVLIPKARLKPQTFNKTLSLTEDARFVQEKKVTKNQIPLKSDLMITMGSEVVIDLQGLGGLLTGGLHLQQEPQGSLNARGELQVKNGRYKAYGQDLAIEQGQLIFTGGPVENPDIGVRASRAFKNASSNFSGSNQLFDFNASNMQPQDFGTETTVGIEVSGRLKSPKITLYSNPANLSQADILSLLLLGKPANQANQAGGQLLLAAISSMNLDSGSKGLQLLDQLKQTLGFDINLESKSVYNQQTNQISEGQAIMVGKSLSKRLYLSYSLGLAQADVNILTISYFLNKFFSVQVNASTSASGIDLLYNSQK